MTVNSKISGAVATILAVLSLGASDAKAEFITDCVEKVAAGSLGNVTYVNVSMGLGSKKVSKQVLGPLYQMYLAAQSEGVTLKLSSAFRTSDEQKHLWNCYQGAVANGCKNEPIFWEKGVCLAKYCPPGCSSCNLAASPGSSNHESGLAIDIHTKSGTNAAYKWLSKDGHTNSKKYGFFPIDAEPWHFDYKGTTPWAGPCGGSGAVWQSVCTPAPIPGAENEVFKDMPKGTFGKKEAEALLSAGITKGCAKDLFCPDCLTTRAMAVTFLLRAAGVELDGENANPTFVDLAPGAYYVPYVEKAAKLGIVSGCNAFEKKFCPDEPATRAEFAKILIKTLDVPLVTPASPSFQDVGKAHWAYAYVETMLDLCVTTGCSAMEFCPEEHTTRAMAAVFMTRAFDLLNENECVSYCDKDSCEASNHCSAWTECTYDGVCQEIGSKERECSQYTCQGPKANATCKATTSMEAGVCERDTDGHEVVGWSNWSPCVPEGPCSENGTQTRTRTVCFDGAAIEETESKTCDPKPDPNCGEDDVVSPDVSTGTDINAEGDAGSDAGAGPEPDTSPEPDISSETSPDADAGSEKATDVNVGARDPGTGKPFVPLGSDGSDEDEGCAAGSESTRTNLAGYAILLLVCLAMWRRVRRCEHPRS